MVCESVVLLVTSLWEEFVLLLLLIIIINVKKNFHRSLTFFVRVEMTHLKWQKLLC